MTPDRMVKTVLYKAIYQDDESYAAVLMRGDRSINEVKLSNVLEAVAVELADDDAVRQMTGAEPGFAGPIGLGENVRIVADKSVDGLTNFLCGANETDVHCLDVNVGRDFPVPQFADVRTAIAGDHCVLDPTEELASVRGIEVGHIFKLGTKYSVAMDATVMGNDGKPHHLVMGCYGIGSTRIAAAAVEQNHDEDGIVWPWSIAPYHAVVMAASKKDENAVAAAEAIYDDLWSNAIETLLDDRPIGVGARMKDAELIGIPFRILVGRGWKEGKVEIKCRRSGAVAELPPADVLAWINDHRK
jgi:prolyl-tRNA synthetase